MWDIPDLGACREDVCRRPALQHGSGRGRAGAAGTEVVIEKVAMRRAVAHRRVDRGRAARTRARGGYSDVAEQNLWKWRRYRREM